MSFGARVLTIAIRPEFQTIEFRGLPGILNKDYISDYVEFCFDIVESCKNEKKYDITTHPKYNQITSKLGELEEDGASQELEVKQAIFPKISPFYSSSYDINFLSKQPKIQEDTTSQGFRNYMSEVNKSKTKLAIPTEKQSDSYSLNCGKTTIEKIIEQEKFNSLFKILPKVEILNIPEEIFDEIINNQREDILMKYKVGQNKGIMNELE